MKIYTKTGDRGETSLYGGKRVPKSHRRIATYGTIDEFGSILGIILTKLKDRRIELFLREVQKDLFTIGSRLAGAPIKIDKIKKRVGEMERLIDDLDKELPRLTNFILPGGTEAANFIFFGRAVIRRAERELVALAHEEKVDDNIIIYLNRLSDCLFIMARYLNSKAKIKETIWKENKI